MEDCSLQPGGLELGTGPKAKLQKEAERKTRVCSPFWDLVRTQSSFIPVEEISSKEDRKFHALGLINALFVANRGDILFPGPSVGESDGLQTQTLGLWLAVAHGCRVRRPQT